MADLASELKRFESGIKRIFDKISGGSGKNEVTSNDLVAERGLINRLKSMEEKYREATKIPEPDYGSLPETLGLKRKTFVPKTDDELRDKAEEALGAAYDAKIAATDLKAAEKTQSLENSLADKTEKYAEDLEYIGEKYATDAEALKNGSIDRGLEDSSVRTSRESVLRTELGNAMNVLRTEHQAQADRIMREIELAETGRANAVNEYRLAYAADVEKKISALKNELAQELETVNSYNAEIAKKEAQYQIDRQKTQDQMREAYEKRQAIRDKQTADYEEKYGYAGAKAEEMEARYNEAEAFYSSIPEEIAKELMSKSEATLKSLLGLYYPRLKNKIFG